MILRSVVAVRFSIAMMGFSTPYAIQLRICDLEKYNRINLHGDIIFCDNRLRCEIHYLLFQNYSSLPPGQ